MQTRKVLSHFILFLLLGLLLPTQVNGQSVPPVVIDGQRVVDNDGALSLDVYFTLPGGGETAVSPPPTAAILLEDETLTQAQVDKPPYYVALVLDASGSMRDVFADAQQAALDLVHAAPPEVIFAVIRFDEQIDVIQPFTDNHNLVTAAIEEIEAADKGTCLYDAAYTAVQSLNQIAPDIPRRAIAIFSDGRDQIVQTSNTPCSRRTYQQAQTFAAAQGMPIYTVGITGNKSAPTIVTISQLAENAASFTNTNADTDTSQSLDIIINHINSQWVAHADLYPTAGLQRGALLLNPASGDPLPPVPLQFYSGRDYATLPPSTIDIVNFRYDENIDAFQFDLLLSRFPANHVLHIETIDSVTNTQVNLISLSNSENSRRIILPTDDLKPDGRYTTHVSLIDNTGSFIKNERGETIIASHEFGYDPPRPLRFDIESIRIEDEPAKLNLRQLRLEDDQPELVVALRLENAGEAAAYNGRFTNLNNNEASDTFTVDIIRSGNIATARIPADFDEETAYRLDLSALNAAGEQLATAGEPFEYATPDGVVARAAKALQANPILWLVFLLLWGIVALLAGLIGHTIAQRRAKPVDTRPGTVPEPVIEQRQPAVLTVLSSPDDELTAAGRWEIEQLPFFIGREGCDLTIAGDRHVSRRHARISYADDDYFIEDLGSSNGTFINATQIAAHEPLALSAERHERIRIGKTTTFVFGELTAEPANEPENSNGAHDDHE
ncbi:MAG: FHA domain-containing protein [Anaerolineales bacterium]|nr:FHA domain-containing protein [Anaerolineales bacterium]